MYLLTD